MKEVSIKAHVRKGKNGKTISVKGYTRRVGRKGIHSPKRERVKPGDEFIDTKQKMEQPKYEGPKMTKEEFERWEKAAREASSRYYGNPTEKKKESSYSKAEYKEPATSSKGILEKLEDRIAKFVDKYSKKKYKKML